MNFQGLPAWASLCDCLGCCRNPASPAGLELKAQRGQGRRREKARLGTGQSIGGPRLPQLTEKLKRAAWEGDTAPDTLRGETQPSFNLT